MAAKKAEIPTAAAAATGGATGTVPVLQAPVRSYRVVRVERYLHDRSAWRERIVLEPDADGVHHHAVGDEVKVAAAG